MGGQLGPAHPDGARAVTPRRETVHCRLRTWPWKVPFGGVIVTVWWVPFSRYRIFVTALWPRPVPVVPSSS